MLTFKSGDKVFQKDLHGNVTRAGIYVQEVGYDNVIVRFEDTFQPENVLLSTLSGEKEQYPDRANN